MQVILRSSLLAVLTGPFFDPESEIGEEMSAFANAILADAPEDVTHFVLADYENGDDLYVSWDSVFGDSRASGEELIPLTYASNGSYYGMARQINQHNPDRGRALYQCYLGGSPINSAPGFVISCARLLG